MGPQSRPSLDGDPSYDPGPVLGPWPIQNKMQKLDPVFGEKRRCAALLCPGGKKRALRARFSICPLGCTSGAPFLPFSHLGCACSAPFVHFSSCGAPTVPEYAFGSHYISFGNPACADVGTVLGPWLYFYLVFILPAWSPGSIGPSLDEDPS